MQLITSAMNATPVPAIVGAASADVSSIISIAVGALLTAAAGLIGAAIQGRREHAKWIRERRYEAFTLMVTQISRAQTLEATLRELERKVPHAKTTLEDERHAQAIKHMRASLEDIGETLSDAASTARLIAPGGVAKASRRLFEQGWADGTSPEAADALDALISSMRKSLRVPQR